MSEDSLLTKLAEICGTDSISTEPQILNHYSKDSSFVVGKQPKCVVWPEKVEEIEGILKIANTMNFPVIPVSSSSTIRRHGDTVPLKGNSIIINLSKMKKILNIDKKNRVVRVEPGVTFGELIPALHKKGVRLLLPLLPDSQKSVITSALDREPITMPRYHWDSSDPLLCTEVVFGSGDLFRTGTAAGPGTLKEQNKSGQAQKNPMGPTQFSPFRIIQGSQGSIGIVSWASLKLEFLPSLQKIYHIQSENIQELLELQHQLIKYRLCDELLILNNLNLACLIEKKPETIKKLANTYSKWNLIFILAGRGKLAQDKLDYLEGDILDIMKKMQVDKLTKTTAINDHELIQALRQSTTSPWRLRLKGICQEIFFLTSFEKVDELIKIAESEIKSEMGIYVQAINQGTAIHLEFDLYYDPKDKIITNSIKDNYIKLSTKLMDNGAFFNRPYGLLTKEAYAHHDPQTEIALKKVKKIFDPNNVLNPGVLCFDD